MALIETPLDVITELASLRSQSEKGVQVLAEAEIKHVRLTLEAERVEYVAFLDAVGAIEHRKAIGRMQSVDAREAAELARVEVSRIKTKLKQLSEAQMAVQTSARMVELQWRSS